MKWTIEFDSSADTNDADYIYCSGILMNIDDTKPEDLKKLTLTIAFLDVYQENFQNYNELDNDGYAKLMNEFLDNEVISEEEVKEFLKNLDQWDLMHMVTPRDPEGDQEYVHDLSITYSKTPENLDNSIDYYGALRMLKTCKKVS